MTTTEALQQVIRNTRIPNLSDITSDDAVTLVRALNEGVQEFFDLAPDRYKRTTFTSLLAAPSELSDVVVTHGEVTVGSGTFTTEQRGATVIITGDASHNEVVDTDAVLRPYLGTTGTTTATIYGDAVPFTDFSIERVVTDARVSNQSLQRRLARVNPEADHLQVWSGNWRSWWDALARSSGHPEYYRIDYVGGSIQTTNDAVMVIRVAPMPTEELVFEIEADFLPIAYAITCINTPKRLPVPRERAATHLLPLIEARLVDTPVWNQPTAATGAKESGAMARQRCRELPAYLANPQHHIRTRLGY